MSKTDNKGLNILIETLHAASSITEYHILDPDMEANLKNNFVTLKNDLVSPEWVERGPDTEAIDALLMTLPGRLKEAKKNRYYYSVSYILKAIFYGLGVGHRPFNEQELLEEVMVIFKRQLRMEQYISIINEAENLDYWLGQQKEEVDKIDKMQRAVDTEKQKQELLLIQNPKAKEEICYVLDPSQLQGVSKMYLTSTMMEAEYKRDIEDAMQKLETTKSCVAAYNESFGNELAKLSLTGGETDEF